MIKKYDKYKSSDVVGIGDVPKDWKAMRFKYFVSQITTPSTSTTKIGLENIQSGTGRFIHTDTKFEGNGVAFQLNDIIYGKLRPYLQKVWLANIEGNAVGDFFVYRAKDDNIPGYLKYVFLSDIFTSLANGSTYGAKMPRVSADFIANLNWFLPSIIEQQSIADYLDYKVGQIEKAIEAIGGKDGQIEKLKKYRQSIISEAVTKGLDSNAKMKDSGIEWIGEIPEGWQISKLGYLTSKIGSGVTPRGGSEVYLDSGILFLRSQNIYPTGLVLDDVAYISEEIDQNMVATRVIKGDVLLNITGASIGRCACYDRDDKANVNQHVCIIRPIKGKLESYFLKYLMNSNFVQNYIMYVQNGANREGLNFEQIRNICIPLPPLSKQQEIADYLDKKTAKIDKAIAELDARQKQLEEYKKSLINEVVTGKIDVRDWNAPA